MSYIYVTHKINLIRSANSNLLLRIRSTSENPNQVVVERIVDDVAEETKVTLFLSKDEAALLCRALEEWMES